jgi:hypothetical protein
VADNDLKIGVPGGSYDLVKRHIISHQNYDRISGKIEAHRICEIHSILKRTVIRRITRAAMIANYKRESNLGFAHCRRM